MNLRDFKWLMDENIDSDVVRFLRQSNADVQDICELGWQGMTDQVILQYAQQAGRIVLTHDSDFGTLAMHGGQTVVGIVYLRPGHIDPQFSIKTLETLLGTELDVKPPFIVVARRSQNHVSIRVRQLRENTEQNE